MPALDPDTLTIGTYTSSYPSADDVVRTAQALEAAGFDSLWSGDQLQFQHPHQLWRGPPGDPSIEEVTAYPRR